MWILLLRYGFAWFLISDLHLYTTATQWNNLTRRMLVLSILQLISLNVSVVSASNLSVLHSSTISFGSVKQHIFPFWKVLHFYILWSNYRPITDKMCKSIRRSESDLTPLSSLSFGYLPRLDPVTIRSRTTRVKNETSLLLFLFFHSPHFWCNLYKIPVFIQNGYTMGWLPMTY